MKKSMMTKLASAAAAVSMVVVGSATSAEAAQSYYSGVNLNCYNYLVILSSTSTGATDHGHWPLSGGVQIRQWNNQNVFQYRISSYFTHVDQVMATTNLQLKSGSRFCDH